MIGKNIRIMRKARNMGQKELAEKLGISFKTVSSWEIGRTEPNIGTIEKLSEIFGCTKSELIDGPKNHEIKFAVGAKPVFYSDIVPGAPSIKIDLDPVSRKAQVDKFSLNLLPPGTSIPVLSDNEQFVLNLYRKIKNKSEVVLFLNFMLYKEKTLKPKRSPVIIKKRRINHEFI